MENNNLIDELKLADLKKENLHKAFDKAHEQANSILSFSLQWEDLTDHLELLENSLKNRYQELELKEKQHELNMEILKQQTKKIELKENELGLIQKNIEGCSGELESKEKQLGLVQKLIQECNCELKSREGELNVVKGAVEDCSGQLSLRKEELGSVQNTIETKEKELCLKEKSLEQCCGELEAKERELGLVKRKLEDSCKEISVKYKQLGVVQKSFQERSSELDSVRKLVKELNGELSTKDGHLVVVLKSLEERSLELDLKEKELDSVSNMVKDCNGELELKEKKLELLQNLMNDCCEQLGFKQKELSGVQQLIEERSKELAVKENHIDSINILIKENAEELEVKEKQYEAMKKSIEGLSVKLKFKEKDLDLIKKSIKECSAELKSKEKDFDLIKNSIKECSAELKSKEKKLDSLNKCMKQRAKEVESKEKELESVKRMVKNYCEDLELKEKQLTVLQSLVKINQPENLPANNAIDSDGRNLQFFLNEHLKKHNLVYGEVSNAIQTATDPAKLVLDAMQGFYPPHSSKGDMEFDTCVNRRSCITLLEQLMNISLQIKPQVRDEAMKLANEWKAKMRVTMENYLEVLGFLLLLATFKLASSFNVDELRSLLDIVAQYRQAPKLHQTLGLADKALVSNILPSQVKAEQPEHSLVNNVIDSSPVNHQFSAMMDRRNLQMVLSEHQGEHDLMHNEISVAFQLSPDPAKFILDVMQRSWKKEGVGFDESLLREYVLFLEQLMQVSPQIKSQVKAEAIKLAIEWKTRLRVGTENFLEVLGFLLLLATYRLASSFNGDEILKLFWPVAQYKQAPEICRGLGFADKTLDIIQNLIDRKQHIEAVRFICAFELVEKFSPVILLKEYLENARKYACEICKKGQNSLEAQDKAIVIEEAALTAIKECVATFKLECALLSENIARHTVQMEKRKADRKLSVLGTPPTVQPQIQGEKNYSIGASVPRDQLQQQHNNKRPRTDTPR